MCNKVAGHRSRLQGHCQCLRRAESLSANRSLLIKQIQIDSSTTDWLTWLQVIFLHFKCSILMLCNIVLESLKSMTDLHFATANHSCWSIRILFATLWSFWGWELGLAIWISNDESQRFGPLFPSYPHCSCDYQTVWALTHTSNNRITA